MPNNSSGIASLFSAYGGSGDPRLDAAFGLSPKTREEYLAEVEAQLAAEEAAYSGQQTPAQPGGWVTAPPKGEGGKNLQSMYSALVERGLPHHVAAGIVGNLAQESGGYLSAASKDGSFGAAQWRGERLHGGGGYTGLYPFAKQRGTSPADLNTQVDYLLHELQGPERKAFNALMNTRNAEEAAMVFGRQFERPNEKAANYQNRIAQAQRFMGAPATQGEASSYPQAQPNLKTFYLDTGEAIGVPPDMDYAEAAKKLKEQGVKGTLLRDFQTPGGLVGVPWDMSDADARAKLEKTNPEMLVQPGMPLPDKSSMTAAGKQALISSLGQMATAGGAGAYRLGEALDSETIKGLGASAEKWGREKEKAAEGMFTPPTEQQAGTLYRKVGIPLAQGVGGMLPIIPTFMLNPAAGAAAVGLQTAGAMKERAEAEGKGETWADLAPYAAGATAINLLPFKAIAPLFKAASSEAAIGSQAAIKKIIEEKGVEAARQEVGSEIGNIAKSMGLTMASGATADVANSVLERASIGKSLWDENAWDEYKEVLAQGAPTYGILGAGAGHIGRGIKTEAVERAAEQEKVAGLVAEKQNEAFKEYGAKALKSLEKVPEEKRTPEQVAAVEHLRSIQDNPQELQNFYNDQQIAMREGKESVVAALPEDLRDLPAQEAEAIMQMEAAKAAKAEEPPKPYYEDLGLSPKSSAYNALKEFDVTNPEHKESIVKILNDTIENPRLKVKNVEAMTALRDRLTQPEQSPIEGETHAQPIPEAGQIDVSGGTQPEIRQEGEGAAISGEGVREGGPEVRAAEEGYEAERPSEAGAEVRSEIGQEQIGTYDATHSDIKRFLTQRSAEELKTNPISIHDLLNHGMDLHKEGKSNFGSFAPLAETLSKMKVLKDVPVSYVPTERNRLGEYMPMTGHIEIDNGGGWHTVLHEAVHAATTKGMLTDKVLHGNIKELYTKAIRHINRSPEWSGSGLEKQYGFRNEFEFVAEALSNDKFKAMLRDMEFSKDKSLWTRFVESIKNYFSKFNRSPELKHALDATLNLSEEAMRKTSEAGTAKLTEAEGELLKQAIPEEGGVFHTPEEELKASGLATEPAAKGIKDKMDQAYRDAVKEGRMTSLGTEYIDAHAGLREALSQVPTIVDKKLRGDLLYSALTQRGNVIQNSYNDGYVVLNSDGTIGVAPDANLAITNIYKKVDAYKGAKDPRKLFNNMMVGLRGKTIHELDAKDFAQGMDWMGKAEAMREYATTVSGKEASKFINAAANLEKLAKEKLDKVRWSDGPTYEGRTHVTPEQAKLAEDILNAHPELKQQAMNIYSLMGKQVDLWVDSGLLTAEQGEKFKKYSYYIPFYKSDEFEKQVADPSKYIEEIASRMGWGPKTSPKIHAQERHAHEIYVEDNLLKHISFMASAAAENSARRNTLEQMELFKKAKRVQGASEDDPQVIKFMKDGEARFYNVGDANAYFALMPAQPLMNPLLRLMRSGAAYMRTAMIVNPLFWIRQLIREPLQASMVAGTGAITPFDAMAALAKISAGTSESYKTLKQRGVVGPVDVISDPAKFVKVISGKKGLVSNGFESLKHIHEAVDSATRVVVYERAKADALAKGLDEATAEAMGAMKARELINFSKQGRSQMVRVLRATTPFFGAALNSMDVLARAAFPTKLGKLSKADAMEARRLFYSNAAMITAFTVAYTMAMSDDEDYLKTPDRANNFLIPTGNEDHPFIKFSVPYEAGFGIKVLPELLTLYNMGVISKTKAVTEAGKSFGELVVPPLSFFAMVKPFAETVANLDFHTMRPIEGGLDASGSAQYRDRRASDTSKAIIKKMADMGVPVDDLGFSPDKLEHLAKGYMAQYWQLGRIFTDPMLRKEGTGEAPEKDWQDLPLISGLTVKGTKDQAVNDFYNLKNKVDAVKADLSHAERGADAGMYERVVSDPKNKPYIEMDKSIQEITKAIGERRAAIEAVNKGHTGKREKKEIIDKLEEEINALSRTGVNLARQLGVEI